MSRCFTSGVPEISWVKPDSSNHPVEVVVLKFDNNQWRRTSVAEADLQVSCSA